MVLRSLSLCFIVINFSNVTSVLVTLPKPINLYNDGNLTQFLRLSSSYVQDPSKMFHIFRYFYKSDVKIIGEIETS